MAGRANSRKFNIRRRVTDTAVTPEALIFAEELLARLVARAYAADNPELFTPQGVNLANDGTSREVTDP